MKLIRSRLQPAPPATYRHLQCEIIPRGGFVCIKVANCVKTLTSSKKFLNWLVALPCLAQLLNCSSALVPPLPLWYLNSFPTNLIIRKLNKTASLFRHKKASYYSKLCSTLNVTLPLCLIVLPPYFCNIGNTDVEKWGDGRMQMLKTSGKLNKSVKFPGWLIYPPGP